MDILKNIFKHKVNVQDVFSSLEKFSGDIRSLSAVRDVATSFFGNNWRFDMEMYIASLPQNYRARYYDIFKQVLEYERAVELWTRATQIVNASRPISSDDLRDIPEYHRYLIKFGIEGERLYSRLLSILGIDKKYADSLSPDTERSAQPQPSSSTFSDTSVASDEQPTTSDETFVANEISSSENLSDTVDVAQSSSVISSNDTEDEDSEYRRQLRNKIMQRVHELSSSHSQSLETDSSAITPDKSSSDIPYKDEDDNDNIEPHLDVADSDNQLDQSLNDGIDSDSSLAQTSDSDSSVIVSDDGDWDIASFVHLNKFLDLSMSIMPAVVLYKNAASLEEYKYYGFIIDVLDYAIAKGSKILSLSSDSEIRKYYQGGKSELENIIISYRRLRDDQVVLSPSDTAPQPEEDKEELPYVRPDNS